VNQYIGIDLHKAKSFVTRLDGRARVLEQVELVHASGVRRNGAILLFQVGLVHSFVVHRR